MTEHPDLPVSTIYRDPLQVTSFKTTDGQIFSDMKKAKAHEAKIALALFMEQEGVGRGGAWDTDMFSDFLVRNAMEIRLLLGMIADGK